MAITADKLEAILQLAHKLEYEISALENENDISQADDEALGLAKAGVTNAVSELGLMARRHRTRRSLHSLLPAGVVLLALMLPTFVQAQTCSFTPYIANDFTERCSLNPYDTERRPNGDLVPKRVCASDPLLAAPAVKLAISEGQVGTPDHERGYIVLANVSTEPQSVIVEIMLRGNNKTTYIKRVSLDPLSSQTIDLTAHPLFQCNARFFNTIVYAERELTAEMLIYALRDPARPLSFVTTDKDGLPIAGGTR